MFGLLWLSLQRLHILLLLALRRDAIDKWWIRLIEGLAKLTMMLGSVIRNTMAMLKSMILVRECCFTAVEVETDCFGLCEVVKGK
jgi:hypothetical protein